MLTCGPATSVAVRNCLFRAGIKVFVSPGGSECALQRGHAVADHPLRDLGTLKHPAGVEGAGVEVQLGADVCLSQPHPEVDRLVSMGIEVTRSDEGARQVAQVLDARRRGQRRHVVRAWGVVVTEVVGPGVLGVSPPPQRRVSARSRGRRVQSVIETRDRQRLMADRRATRVPGPDRRNA